MIVENCGADIKLAFDSYVNLDVNVSMEKKTLTSIGKTRAEESSVKPSNVAIFESWRLSPPASHERI